MTLTPNLGLLTLSNHNYSLLLFLLFSKLQQDYLHHNYPHITLSKAIHNTNTQISEIKRLIKTDSWLQTCSDIKPEVNLAFLLVSNNDREQRLQEATKNNARRYYSSPGIPQTSVICSPYFLNKGWYLCLTTSENLQFLHLLSYAQFVRTVQLLTLPSHSISPMQTSTWHRWSSNSFCHFESLSSLRHSSGPL